MKAIIRGGAGLSALMLLCSVTFGYTFITPVSKIPYPQAPNTYNSRVLVVDPWGRVIGTYYALTPPFPPHMMPLPGPIGQAINSGYLPHTLLLDKKAMDLGDAPLLKQRGKKANAPTAPTPPNPFSGPPGGGMPGGYPTVSGGEVASRGPAQMPYGGVPTSPYPTQSPYAMGPGPYGSMLPPMAYGPMPGQYTGPMGMGMQQNPMMVPARYPGPTGAPMQAMPTPYTGPQSLPQQQSVMPPWMMQNQYQPIRPMAHYYYQRNPWTGQVVLVQHLAPTPIMPIPGYNPAMPALPGMPAMPGMPAVPAMPAHPSIPSMPSQPRMDMAPYPGFQYFGPMQTFDRMGPLQGPRMEFQPLQLPRMDMAPPPQEMKGGGSAYPVHPFIRSPRDFFMWGEMMDEERSRGSRPNPVP